MPDFLTTLALPRRNGVYYLADPAAFAAQESAYLRVRQIEGRLYDDAALRKLPIVSAGHKHANEWLMRLDSAARLHKHLAAKPASLAILDLGCGNGWMTNKLAGLAGADVVGMDINGLETDQAARVFGRNERLAFVYGDVFDNRIPADSFDAIVLASSAQYFGYLPGLIARLRQLLRANGEIHILDTPFYEEKTITAARQRTQAYYESFGAPEMAQFYHHHLWSEIAVFEPDVMYDPDRTGLALRRRFLGQALSPFLWLLIRK